MTNIIMLIICVTFIVWFTCMTLLYRNRRRSISSITRQCKYISLLIFIFEMIIILTIQIVTLR